MRFPEFKQLDAMDCGPTCLRMVAAYHGRTFDRTFLREQCSIGRAGVSLLGISEAAERIGMRSLAVKLPFKTLSKEVPLPCIVHWQQGHFVVVYKISKTKVYVADPELGKMTYSHAEFLRHWLIHKPEPTPDDPGVLLLLEPTPKFHEVETPQPGERRGLGFFFAYLKPHKRLFGQLAVGLLAGLVLDLIFPFMTQAVVDIGIGQLDLNIIYLLLAGQLMLAFSQTAINMLRSWIFLHVGSRVSISLITDFLHKLLKLPVGFFETRTSGDIMQRIEDHDRIRRFLTSTSLDVVFSVFSFFVFAAILAVYNLAILGVFIGMTLLSVGWLTLFLKRRRILDQKQFENSAKEQDKFVEIVSGAQEVKIQGIEKKKRWEWEEISIQEFRLEQQGLVLRQAQKVGTFFFGQIRNILITFLAARAVIHGDMTLGMMLSTQYIIGQLNSPVHRLIDFIHRAQDARLSLERMEEVYSQPEEDHFVRAKPKKFPPGRTLTLQNLTFRYPGAGQKDVLDNISLQIPEGKVTAIVGSSGSGKTTLLKLLLGLHQPQKGHIFIGPSRLDQFDGQAWMDRCGVVMQDGFIFPDTIGRNIACGTGEPDHTKLHGAVWFACLNDFIDKLPLGLDTRIGNDGQGVSGGQHQRILIARAVYKNPEFLLLDEATSSLDAKNEHAIMANLDRFIKGRTVVVIAHRLSTVKNADQIVVLDEGKVVEVGTHDSLVARPGYYYNLIRNQLELEALQHAS